MQQSIFVPLESGSYKSLGGSLWKDLFKLHELFEIVRQSSDPEFAEMLARLREGNQTDSDIGQMRSLSQTDVSSWPQEYVKLFLTNHLADKENEECIEGLQSDVFVINAEDSARDVDTGIHPVSISQTLKVSQKQEIYQEN
jgi:hypothetical protein